MPQERSSAASPSFLRPFARVPVPRRWPGSAIVVVAPGPSLTIDDLADVLDVGVPTLAVNDAIFEAPFADVLYAADPRWWAWHAADVRSLPCWKYSARLQSTAYDSAIGVLRPIQQPGLSDDPSVVHTGGEGGYQALNLAAHLVGPGGTIILLGFDLQPAVAADGTIRHHVTREHPDRSHPRYARWLPTYAAAYHACRARSIRLVNATRSTAITAVPRVDLAAALAGDIPT